jgi:transcriptional regulator with XRE-family HTH domain
MNRSALADFLRSRRSQLRPTDLGLPTVGRRRTPGLRREEVAQRAAISVDYYVRLEQARAPQPSPQVLESLANALALTVDEHDHLYWLAGHRPPADRPATDELRPVVRRLLDQLDETPAQVTNRLLDLLACNKLYAALANIDLDELPERNAIVLHFCHPDVTRPFLPEDFQTLGRNHVAYLHGMLAQHPNDAALNALVQRLLAGSTEFAALWERHDVNVQPSLRKRIIHRDFGVLELTCETVLVPETDQRLVLYTAEPDTPTAAALDKLRRRTLSQAVA